MRVWPQRYCDNIQGWFHSSGLFCLLSAVPSLRKEVLCVADILPTILGRLDMAALLLAFRDITKVSLGITVDLTAHGDYQQFEWNECTLLTILLQLWFAHKHQLYTAVQDSPGTFNLQAPCILSIGQAFRYSPQNSFYIFNQQIYFII